MPAEIEAALIGALAAILGAAVAGWIAWVAHKQAVSLDSAREIREVLLKLLECREQAADQWKNTKDAPEREMNLTIINNKRRLYIGVAQSMIPKAKSQLTSQDYEFLGYECFEDFDFEAAKNHYESALEKAKKQDLLDQVNALRFLGDFYFSISNPFLDFDRANRFYGRAVELIKDQTDPYYLYQLGLTCENWARNLAIHNVPKWSDTYDLAQGYYDKLPPNYHLRSTILETSRARRNMLAQQLASNTPIKPQAPSAATVAPTAATVVPQDHL